MRKEKEINALWRYLTNKRSIQEENAETIKFYYKNLMVHAVAQWLRHCATNRRVTGSIPDGVIGIFH
jgi:hypothetical protein